jgi:hypothetical protein
MPLPIRLPAVFDTLIPQLSSTNIRSATEPAAQPEVAAAESQPSSAPTQLALRPTESSPYVPNLMQFSTAAAADPILAAGGDRAAQAAFAQLPAPQQAHFQEVLEKVSNGSTLLNLLTQGDLQKTDSQGQSMIDNLARLANGPHQSGVNGPQLATEAVQALSNRNYISQGPHGTCGAASLENLIWSKDPAELLRVVTDLAQNGSSELRSGYQLKAAEGSLDWHRGDLTTAGRPETRSDFDIVFQSAIMRSAAVNGSDRSFAMIRMKTPDTADYNVSQDTGDPEAVLRGDSASNPRLIAQLAEDITGKPFQLDLLPGKYERIKGDLEAGKEPISLLKAKGGQIHYVTLLEQKQGQIIYQDTATNDSQSRIRSMSVDDFKDQMVSAIRSD